MDKTVGIDLFDMRERARQSLWFIPTIMVVAFTATAIALVALDSAHPRPDGGMLIFSGSADGAREFVSTIAGSMVAFVGTVFSITILVLQLASSQFSPRALRNFLRDRRTQVSLGVFLGTMAYALVVLWTIRSPTPDDDGFLPHLTVSGAYVTVALSLATFVFYIHHVSQSIRVANVVHRIGTECLHALDRRYPKPFDPAAEIIAPPELCGLGQLVSSTGYGVVTAVDEDRLLDRASRLDGRVEIVPYTGDFVPIGGPLGYWVGDPEALEELDLQSFVSLGRERTMEQDLAFGIRQLVDIAEKALSPGVNDPTTAGQALDQLHNLLRQLAHRTFPRELKEDRHHTTRLIRHERSWDDLVHASFDEIRDYGERSIQIQERLHSLLHDLVESAPAERRRPLQQQFDALVAGDDPRPR